jgi:hypothetical protein
LKLLQASGRVILKLPQNRRSELPSGDIAVTIDGEEYIARFAQEYINVVKRGNENVLSQVMRLWFGDRAGERGTKHEVRLRYEAGWHIEKIV